MIPAAPDSLWRNAPVFVSLCCDVTRVATAPEPRSDFGAGKGRVKQKSTIRFPNVVATWLKQRYIGGESCKRVRLSSPMSPHAISNLRIPVNGDDDKVELKENGMEDDDNTDDDDKLNYNLLISRPKLLHFISNNFVCKECWGKIRVRDTLVEQIGWASNGFFSCGEKKCVANDQILANQSKMEASGRFRRKHPELPHHLGDYDINRQVVLACQMSGGGARQA